jgi:hypothetical protein
MPLKLPQLRTKSRSNLRVIFFAKWSSCEFIGNEDLDTVCNLLNLSLISCGDYLMFVEQIPMLNLLIRCECVDRNIYIISLFMSLNIFKKFLRQSYCFIDCVEPAQFSGSSATFSITIDHDAISVNSLDELTLRSLRSDPYLNEQSSPQTVSVEHYPNHVQQDSVQDQISEELVGLLFGKAISLAESPCYGLSLTPPPIVTKNDDLPNGSYMKMPFIDSSASKVQLKWLNCLDAIKV